MPRRKPEEFVEPHRIELVLLAASQMGPLLRQKVGPEDVAQDAIINAVTNWHSFRGDPLIPAQLTAWLKAILIHEVRESYRRYTTLGRDMTREMSLVSDPNQSSAGIDAYACTNSHSPQDSILRREKLEKLRAALKTLPLDEEQVVIARYINQMKIKEIAQFLDMSEKMVSDRIAKGITKLLDVMGGDDFWSSLGGGQPAA